MRGNLVVDLWRNTVAANTSIKAMPEGARAVHYGGPGASEDGDVSDGDRGGIDCRCRNSSPALRLPSFPSLEAATAAGIPTVPKNPKPGGTHEEGFRKWTQPSS